MTRLLIVAVEIAAVIVWAFLARELVRNRAGDDQHLVGILARIPILALLVIAAAVGTRIATPGPVPWQLPWLVLPSAVVMLVTPAVLLHDEKRRRKT